MKISEIRELTIPELLKRRRELREETFNLRLQQKAGQIENTARFRQIRREVARIETVIKEKKAKAAAQAPAAA